MVERVGKSVKGVKIGDHVVLSYQSCGQCRPCRRGHPADCEWFYEANFGFARLDGSNALQGSGVRGHFFGQSSFATHAVATTRNLVKVPKTLSLGLLAPLGCGIQTGAGTVMNSLAVRRGSSIAVFGMGAVGLAAVMAARIVGARTIIAVDIKSRRLKLAMQLGATHAINNHLADLTRSISAITGGGVDYVVESTGDAHNAPFRHQPAKSTRKSGSADWRERTGPPAGRPQGSQCHPGRCSATEIHPEADPVVSARGVSF